MTVEAEQSSTEADQRVVATLRRALRRWRGARMLLALDAAIVIGALAAAVAIAVMDSARFSAEVVANARLAFHAFVALALAGAVSFALLRRPSDIEIAGRIEAASPELDALLLTAVERRVIQPRPGTLRSPALERRLAERAAEASARVGLVERVDRATLHRAGAAGLLVVTLLCAAVLFGPPRLQHGVAMLLLPDPDPERGNPYTVLIRPGDATILEGEDLRLEALPAGFTPSSFELVMRRPGDDVWERRAMAPIRDDEGFDAFVFDVGASFEYYALSGDVRSATHRVEVIPRARVEQIDLRYRYPRYTGLAPREVEDGGDIRAVAGTRVEIRALPSSAVSTGQLVIDGERRIALEPDGDYLRAVLDVTESGQYRIDLPAGDSEPAPASPVYAIVALDDRPPSVSFTNPGRDIRVTSIEEVELAARAEDDVAVHSLELVVSVNGGEEEVIALAPETGDATAIDGSHLLFLEERGLAPGDLIAFYARVRDSADATRPPVATDMFFLDVRPFEQNFRRARGGSQQGGGGQQGGETLSAQQRSLVVALFKLLRDRGLIAEGLIEERIGTLRGAQMRIRERTDAIVRRLGSRGIVRLRPGYKTMAEELPKAASAMHEVEALLSVPDLDASMPAARKALSHLQRADAAFRDVQVAESRQGGSGAAANELADLFQLEMDRFRSPYETLQRGQREAARAQLDEALRKLAELARRQQREVERARRRAESGQRGGADSQARLAEEVEELLRRLERLSRERDSESLRQSARDLASAASAMRNPANGDASEAGKQALEQLREAQAKLEAADGPARLGSDVEAARSRAETLAREQREIGKAIERIQATGDADREAVAPLLEREQKLGEGVRELEGRIDRLAREQRTREPAVGRQLREAARGARADEIGKRIEATRDRLRRDAGAAVDDDVESIARGLDALGERLGEAARTAGRGGRDGRIAAGLRDTIGALERSRNRLAERQLGGALTGGGGSPDNLGSADLADLRHALDSRLPALEALAGTFRSDAHLGREVDALIEAIRRVRDAGIDPALVTRQVELLEAIKRLEYRLRAEAPDPAPAVANAVTKETPVEYRSAIEGYFRDLSEQRSE